jgi:hypothetical protein
MESDGTRGILPVPEAPGFMAASVPTRRSDGRSEGRIPKRMAAELARPSESVPKEMTFTENVSIRGARLTTVRRWQPGTRVLVTFLRNGARSEGKVAYCQRNESGDFAIGVELSGLVQRRMENLT